MKKLFLLVTTVLLALTSCTEENAVNESLPLGKIQATFEEGIASRLAVGDKNVLTWSTEDAFSMFNENGNGTEWTLEGTGGEETGVFAGVVPTGTLKGAAFPATASPSWTGNDLTMNLPAELTYKAGICNLPMWASFSSIEENISFKHLAALLKVDFTDIPEGYTSLVVTTDKPIAGMFTADMSQQEPVLKPVDGGINSVKVSFAAIGSEDNDRMFYIPLPVGTYEFINVSISNGTNTISIADWSKRTIVRKKVYVTSLSYRVSDKTTPLEITEELNDMMKATSNATIELTDKVDASEGTIVIPTEASKVALNFEETPTTTESAPLTIAEEPTADGAELTVSLPTALDGGAYIEFNTPTTTVNVEGGNYQKIVARTAANTLVLGANTTVANLVILGGNVVLDGGKITGSVTRDPLNADEVTYLYVDDEKELEGVTIGAGIKLVVDPQGVDYLTFTADSEQTLSLSREVETLEYSVDGSLWKELGTTVVTFGGEKGTLRLRGKSAIGTAVSKDDAALIIFGNLSVPVAASGDIRTLVDFQKYDSDELDTSNARFCNLFFECTNLTTAPKLPAMTLASECYWQMFVYCSSLTEAPELPATTLVANCYQLMFYGCTSLTKAPELPATTLVPNSYYGLFYGCTSLKYAPKRLPAMALTADCYSYMFYNCTNLITAPELPATSMAERCYLNMFNGCKNLTEAPALPATTLAADCYSMMFYNCSSLAKAPELPATTMVARCYSNMFFGCKSLIEAPALPATTLARECYIQIFAGCSKIKTPPVLPAQTLAYGCYRSMFMDCSSLTEAPELPVTTLEDYCYYGLFWNCSSLKKAPELPATVMAKECYTVMFGGCSSLTEASELPSTTLADYCYSSMFSDCINLKATPELPATTLANGCYNSMFSRCTNLVKVSKLPATEMTDYCYSGMFAGCTSLSVAPELPAKTLAKGCYFSMFQNCTALTTAPVLPAVTLANRCYMFMFSNCTNLNSVAMLATDVSADLCLDLWLDRVSTTGVFYKNSSVTDYSAYGIPEGWEVKDY